MPSSSMVVARDRLVRQLMSECLTFELTEEESMIYITQKMPDHMRFRHNRTQYAIGRSSFYKYKKIVEEELGDVDTRMRNHAKIGFVKQHFEIIDDVKNVLKNLRSAFFLTTDPQAKANYSAAILNYEAYLYQLNIASPVIEQMKQYVRDHLNNSPVEKQEGDKNVNVSVPESRSACTLPEGFIKPGHNAGDDRGGVPTGSKSPDRVF